MSHHEPNHHHGAGEDSGGHPLGPARSINEFMGLPEFEQEPGDDGYTPGKMQWRSLRYPPADPKLTHFVDYGAGQEMKPLFRRLLHWWSRDGKSPLLAERTQRR